MRYTTSDPRVRQTLNHITENLESANQRTQATLFTVSENCIQPCLASLQPCLLSFQTCLEASCQPCFSARDDVRRHRQPRYSRRGRETAAFDFYDDWEREEEEWGNDELDALLSGNETQQPGRNAGMTYGYGTRGPRRRSTAGKDALADDPTVVPQSSIFGFLERLPWKIGGRGARYRPNAASLQTNVGRRGQEADPLMPDDEGGRSVKKGRARSGTAGSKSTVNSLSSRGDIFPSDDEDDAREIDDEFALRLGRRSTNATTSEDRSSKKRPFGSSRASTKTTSSDGTKQGIRSTSASSDRVAALASPAEDEPPMLTDLKREEEEVQEAEESELQVKRQAAQRLASERGLDSPTKTSERDSKEASLISASEVDDSPQAGETNVEINTTTRPNPVAEEGANTSHEHDERRPT
ncbi:MAG: hypothetical protein OHK93_002229 [Ramalina farinacea]|uniref:Uncharacterized protein n=1 Tax=Ramalina farinacea TaxID=258253 RepID=A0AA43TX07_9LECA|nr:hypothetical protein [Ramalina farinacea]